MNLCLEYIYRDNRCHALLTIPCSLFLTTSLGNKLVLTIKNTYGGNKLMIKHWKTWLAKDRLPPFDEFSTNRDDIFESPHVILEDCKILDYAESPFDAGGRQYADFPHSQIQEQAYKSCLENFYNSDLHQNNRTNWLWDAFEKAYVPLELRFRYSRGSQREVVQYHSKPLWNIWQCWRKHLLDFSGAAAELVFRRDYVKEEPPKIKFRPYAWSAFHV